MPGLECAAPIVIALAPAGGGHGLTGGILAQAPPAGSCQALASLSLPHTRIPQTA